ncbi:DUF4222 domain-containing protein [Serratia nevei]|uniref:DUF4222 domain-containing protein n=2 Tax=Serratia TaxID=613 RepID=UPI0027D2E3CA|nr:DUF4222 domain-containing protein [Serratia nevei]WMC74727.1 DUF4222 domain-containing protein [Serratia nevei]WMC80123.1 DUF4222 domain-containing protein [Serratia nevei]BEO77380.1 hypothetical protein SMTE4_33500 [Serratia marcescens]
MNMSAAKPKHNQRYKDARGKVVTVISVAHNRVTFIREGYESPCVQPLIQFIENFTLQDGGSDD